MTPEQRYRLECMKERTPSTNHFLCWIPLFLFLAWIGRESLPELDKVAVGSYPVREAVSYRPSYNPHRDASTFSLIAEWFE
jgi:hypothetical protein